MSLAPLSVFARVATASCRGDVQSTQGIITVDDVFKPLTMAFGLLLGLTSGAFLSEHRATWQAAALGACELGAIEIGQLVDDDCPAAETPSTIAFLSLALPADKQ